MENHNRRAAKRAKTDVAANRRHKYVSENVNAISLEHFPKAFGVTVDKKLYDVRSLQKYWQSTPGKHIVPHTRQEASPQVMSNVISAMHSAPVQKWAHRQNRTPVNATPVNWSRNGLPNASSLYNLYKPSYLEQRVVEMIIEASKPYDPDRLRREGYFIDDTNTAEREVYSPNGKITSQIFGNAGIFNVQLQRSNYKNNRRIVFDGFNDIKEVSVTFTSPSGTEYSYINNDDVCLNDAMSIASELRRRGFSVLTKSMRHQFLDGYNSSNSNRR